jgi:hypothetical protein
MRRCPRHSLKNSILIQSPYGYGSGVLCELREMYLIELWKNMINYTVCLKALTHRRQFSLCDYET